MFMTDRFEVEALDDYVSMWRENRGVRRNLRPILTIYSDAQANIDIKFTATTNYQGNESTTRNMATIA